MCRYPLEIVMKTAFGSLVSVICVVACVLCTCSRSDANMLSPGGGTIAKFNFDGSKPWPKKAVVSSNGGQIATLVIANIGTINIVGSAKASGGLLFSAKNVHGIQSAAFVSGKLPIRCRETDPNKLTLSFSLSASSTRPVTVRVESFDTAKKRTGGLETQIFPAAPQFYQRYSIDLFQMKAFGFGRFRPTDPFVQFIFAVQSLPMASAPESVYELHLDNVNYAGPAYYVSPQGNDRSDGRTEKTAFATPQKALDTAQPGDIVLLMNGTYRADRVPVASFPRPGTPDAWIVLKNYPGQRPTLTSNGWNIISIAKGSSAAISHDPPLAYLEVRGLHIRGEGDVAKQKYAEAMDKADSRTNSNGIAADGRFSAGVFHDIRIADNLVEFSPGCGIGTIDADWVTVENNICRCNCWTTIYAPSGISVMGPRNFDAAVNIYKRLVRNNICCHNQTYEKWSAIGKYSDGNGIILDVNQGSDQHPKTNYIGRTLVQSNLSYDNGGSGIHTVRANRVDIINNTAYLNSASVHLEYSEIFTDYSDDVRIINNILVAPVANVAAGEKPEPVNQCGGKNTRIVFSHNLYFGGNIAPTLGVSDVVGDPRFLNPSKNDKVADFHLRSDSPAVGKGITVSFSPLLDLAGNPRRPGNPTEGAYEK